MRIIQLEAENVKRIKAISIKADPNINILEGKNEQGKTSALDCIAMALGGKKLIPDEPIRHGEEKAEIKVDLGDYLITRRFTQKDSSLKVENKDGMQAKSPQKMLDELIGNLAFDPMEFCSMDKAKRSKVLTKLTGLDYTDLKIKYDKAYQDRQDFSRDFKGIKVRLDDYVKDSKQELMPCRTLEAVEKERQEIYEHNRQIEKAKEILNFNTQRIAACLDKVESHKNEIKQLEIKVEKIRQDEKPLGETANLEIKDSVGLTAELKEINDQAVLKSRMDQKGKLESELRQVGVKVKMVDSAIESIRQEKMTMTSEAKFPVDGLGFQNDDVSFNGVEFSQISMAQKIKVSMAIAMALNPKIKIIRILNGSLLDKASMDEIKRIAIEKDYQIWLEKISESKSGNAIYIEDGEIK